MKTIQLIIGSNTQFNMKGEKNKHINACTILIICKQRPSLNDFTLQQIHENLVNT